MAEQEIPEESAVDMAPCDGPTDDGSTATDLLQRWSSGEREAMDRLVPIVYDELRRLSRAHLRMERPGHTLQSTALVHEVFLRLAVQRSVQFDSRAQFFGWASQLMRRILVDHARARLADKRGGTAARVSLDEVQESAAGGESVEWRQPMLDELARMVEVDSALRRMQQMDPRRGRIVELRFFGGLTVEETAEVLEISPSTVLREWSTARAWLRYELRRGLHADGRPS